MYSVSFFILFKDIEIIFSLGAIVSSTAFNSKTEPIMISQGIVSLSTASSPDTKFPPIALQQSMRCGCGALARHQMAFETWDWAEIYIYPFG